MGSARLGRGAVSLTVSLRFWIGVVDVLKWSTAAAWVGLCAGATCGALLSSCGIVSAATGLSSGAVGSSEPGAVAEAARAVDSALVEWILAVLGIRVVGGDAAKVAVALRRSRARSARRTRRKD